jgi:hypothetical protein
MMNKRDTLPDLGDITGQFNHNGNPILRRDLTDTPDPARIADMRERLLARINELPRNAQSGAGWSEPNKWGISNDDLYGPYDSKNLDAEQRELAYRAITEGRSRAEGVEYLEHGHVLGSEGLDGLSQSDIDRLDANDARIAQESADMWRDFAERWPDLAADPQLVAEAVEVANHEIAQYGDNPTAVARHDRANYLKHVAQAARNGSTTRQNLETYREYGIEPADSRTDVSYGGGGPKAAASKREEKSDMVEDLQFLQRKSGLW